MNLRGGLELAQRITIGALLLLLGLLIASGCAAAGVEVVFAGDGDGDGDGDPGDGDGDPEQLDGETGDGDGDGWGGLLDLGSGETGDGDGDPGDGDGDGDGETGETGDGDGDACGDGVVGVSEECDDGNDVDADACTNACTVAVCGDGVVQAGVEECDNPQNPFCEDDCMWPPCPPDGSRAPFDTLGINTASGGWAGIAWDGNPCAHDDYAWEVDRGQSFQGFGEAISCMGEIACVGNVGITTYESANACQGAWEVLCDGFALGTIDTIGKGCSGSAMANGCDLGFTPRFCVEVELRAVVDGDGVAPGECFSIGAPDSMITGVSAW